jgi:hypothetical protein
MLGYNSLVKIINFELLTMFTKNGQNQKGTKKEAS